MHLVFESKQLWFIGVSISNGWWNSFRGKCEKLDTGVVNNFISHYIRICTLITTATTTTTECTEKMCY